MEEKIKIIDEKIEAAKKATEEAAKTSEPQEDIFDNLAAEIYYAPGDKAFINITGTTASNAECTFSMVNCYGYDNVCGYTSNFSAATVGRVFTATFPKNQWYYYKNGVKQTNTPEEEFNGKWGGGTITIQGITYTKYI